MNWHYLEGNDQRGPVSDADLEALIQAGKVGNDTLVWREGMAEWKPLSEARGVVATVATPQYGSQAPAGNQIFCIECGNPFPPDQVIRHGDSYICAGCKPAFLQKLREGVALPTGALNYAGFWIRFGAVFVDGVILGVINVAIGFAMGTGLGQPNSHPLAVAHFGLNLLIGAAYYTLLLGKYGATLGKMATKLRVVNPDGSPISYGKALGRYFAANWISGCLTVFIGYLMVCWDSEKRALHDRICGTRVVRV